MVFAVEGTSEVKRIFSGWQETMVWSCLQGVMGKLYADSVDEPKSAMAVIGDFCFFAGVPNRELVSFRPEQSRQDFIIMTSYTPDWHPLIEEIYGNKAKKVTRYATKKEAGILDREKLKMYVNMLPEGFCLKMLDEEIYDSCLKEAWSRDFVSLYKDYEEYRKMGLGVVAVKDGEIVAGASSYSSYEGGIEIEIDTREDYRRRGLATACGARLILECMARDRYPSWDAQNKWSLSLAEKLGYHFDHAYVAYEVFGYGTAGQNQAVLIRELKETETGLLKDFLYEAIFIPEGVSPPDKGIVENKELRVYTEHFGERKGDYSFVAEVSGQAVGAVWTRIMDDYGHIDDETPSFAISLYQEYRGQGIGTQLMLKMLQHLKEQGYQRASLAVWKTNYAVRMYEKVGFKIVDENEQEFIMVWQA